MKNNCIQAIISLDTFASRAYLTHMANNRLTREDVISLLKSIQGERSMTALADELGVSKAYLSDVLRGNRSIGPSILKPLGIVAETKIEIIYRKVA